MEELTFLGLSTSYRVSWDIGECLSRRIYRIDLANSFKYLLFRKGDTIAYIEQRDYALESEVSKSLVL